MKISLSHYYKTTAWLVTLLACWLSAGAQTRTVQLPHGKLVYTITNLGDKTIEVKFSHELKASYCISFTDLGITTECKLLQ